MLQSALEHYRRQQRITALGLIAARRARYGSLAQLVSTVAAFQLVAAQDASAAVPLILAEQNISTAAVQGSVLTALLGTASDGRSLAGLLDYTRYPDVTDFQFDQIVSTQLQDVARATTSIEMATRPQVTGYVRLLNPPSCSRCTILAGRTYKWNAGFQRHPRCDCRHVPAGAGVSDLISDPKTYFNSLDPAAQNKTFTKAGAEAIRLGANPINVVNARRGMRTAQVYGQDVLITSEGTTRRGAFSQQRRAEATARGVSAAETSTRRGRRGVVPNYQDRRITAPRLMPETILDISNGDRAEALRLLKFHGYVSP